MPRARAAIRQRARSPSEISFEIARTSIAGTPASAHARRTAKPSIPSTRTSAAPPTDALVPIGSESASGTASRTAASSRAIGLEPVDDRNLRGDVAVDGLAPDHDPARGDAASARDADVQHGVRRVERERARRRGSRLDRADPAREPGPVAELDVGRGDEEDVGHVSILRLGDQPEDRMAGRLGQPLVVAASRARRRRTAA